MTLMDCQQRAIHSTRSSPHFSFDSERCPVIMQRGRKENGTAEISRCKPDLILALRQWLSMKSIFEWEIYNNPTRIYAENHADGDILKRDLIARKVEASQFKLRLIII